MPLPSAKCTPGGFVYLHITGGFQVKGRPSPAKAFQEEPSPRKHFLESLGAPWEESDEQHTAPKLYKRFACQPRSKRHELVALWSLAQMFGAKR